MFAHLVEVTSIPVQKGACKFCESDVLLRKGLIARIWLVS